jgi:hypothetical protein
MYDIEPWWGWRDEYTAENDSKTPFFRKSYDEFKFTNQIYNYFIHPQWDYLGSETLYGKILYVDYKRHFALIELIGEWNDCITNDSMFIKRDLADFLIKNYISKFVIFCDNVLNFHGDDDSYYEEWYDDVKDDRGWICLINTFDHVATEMNRYRLNQYLNFGPEFNDFNWRTQKPAYIVQELENIMNNQQKKLL